MATIHATWRKKGAIWYARFKHPTTRKWIERSTGCRTRRLAEQWLEREWSAILDPDAAPLPQKGLAVATAEYLIGKQREIDAGLLGADRPSTLTGRKKKLRLIVRTMGPDRVVADIVPADVEWFRDLRMQKVSAQSVHKDLIELRLLMRWCVKLRYIESDPTEGIDVAFKIDKRDRSITPEQFHKLYEALAEKRRLYALLIVETGARPGREVESILWSGLDVERCLLHVPGEKTTAADRWLPVRPEFVAHLVSQRGCAADDEPIVERWGNAPRDFKKASAKAGIPPVRPYDLRHTYASWALQGGAPDTHVAKALGHSSTAMVHRVYGHLRPDHLKSVTTALPASPILSANLPIQAQQSEETSTATGASDEILAQYMPKNPSHDGQNAAKCDECYAGEEGTKNPAELSNPAGFNGFPRGDDQDRTGEWRFCRPLPYHLATSP